MYKRTTHCDRAFTLVELLVVVGVITVLLAVLLPTLSKAREQARRVKCAANLRQLGVALVNYTQQFGVYPGSHTSHTGSMDAAIWPTRLRGFFKGNQEVFYCPSQPEACRWSKGSAPAGPAYRANAYHARFGYEVGEPLLTPWLTYFSYGYNSRGTATLEKAKGLGYSVSWSIDLDERLRQQIGPDAQIEGRYRELRVVRVKRPSQMIAIADTSADGWADFIISYVHVGGAHGGTQQTGWPGKVHGGGANVLFCDGHVQWYPQDVLVDTKNSNGYGPPRDIQVNRMWNHDHEPHFVD